MKVLLVSACELPHSFNRFITVFRSKIGTCESIRLPEQQSFVKQKQLFEQYRDSMLFDRFVAYYQGKDDFALIQSLCSGLPQQTLLCLQPECAAQRKLVAKYAKINPWLRWAGSDATSFEYYKRCGIDAYLLPPLSTPSYWYGKQSKVDFRCHVLGKCNHIYLNSLPDNPMYCQYNCVENDLRDYIRKEVKEGDVVLISSQAFLERHLIADAIANGAAVVVPTSDVSLDKIDELVRQACVTIDNPDELLSLFEQIKKGSNKELLNKIFSQVSLFSPERVGTAFEQLVVYPGRERSAYVRRSTWL